MDYHQKLRLNLTKSAGIEQSYDGLPDSSQREVDVALCINGRAERVQPDVMGYLKEPTEFGFWVFNVLYLDDKIKPALLLKRLAKVLVASSDYITGKTYVQSVASAFAEVSKRDLDSNAFADEFLFQALRKRKGVSLKPLLHPAPPSKDGSMLAATDADAAQVLLLAAFQRHGGLKNFLSENFSKNLVGRLVLEHGLSGLATIISRKDRGSLLSIELGM